MRARVRIFFFVPSTSIYELFVVTRHMLRLASWPVELQTRRRSDGNSARLHLGRQKSAYLFWTLGFHIHKFFAFKNVRALFHRRTFLLTNK